MKEMTAFKQVNRFSTAVDPNFYSLKNREYVTSYMLSIKYQLAKNPSFPPNRHFPNLFNNLRLTE